MSALKEEDFKDRNEKSNSSISYIIDFKEEEKKKKKTNNIKPVHHNTFFLYVNFTFSP